VAEKTNPRGASEALEDLGTGFERFANWVGTHPLWALGAVLALLAIGGGWELVRSRAEHRETAASDALDQIQNDYLAAMGAEPGSVEVPELANPETAKRIRAEYVDKYRAVAEAHPGTVPAALAWLEVADLQDAEGDREASFASLQKGLAEQPENPRLAGLVHQRIAQNYEDRGMLAEAAAEHEKAGELPGFPLRYFALSDAARCYAQAGQRDRARELLERIETEAKDVYQLPPDQRALLRELRVSQPPPASDATAGAEPAH
jgi:tetratricopeptide (TPR) repeat protein